MVQVSNATLLANCPQQLDAALSTWGGFFDLLSAKIFQLTTGTHSSAARNSHFFVMNQLHAQQSEIAFNLNRRIQTGFRQFCMPITVGADRSPLNLASHALNNELTALHYRLSKMLEYGVSITELPLHPLALQASFSKSWQSFDFEAEITDLAYQTFEQFIAEESERLSHVLNKWLISHNISPELRYKNATARRQQSFVTDQPARDTSTQVDGRQESHKGISAIKQGDWLTRTNPHQSVRFAWVSKLTGKYIFVARDGLVAFDLNETELLQSLTEGRLTP